MWPTILKMSVNDVGVYGNPRLHSQDRTCRRCPTCGVETLAHVLGFCDYGHQYILSRHNDVNRILFDILKLNGKYIVHLETPCTPEAKRVDLLVYTKDKKQGWILDPTIRMENTKEQPLEVHDQKVNHYTSCIDHYKEEFGVENIEIIGLMIGARGTITKQFLEFCKQFEIPSKTIEDIILKVVEWSVIILNHHLSEYNMPANRRSRKVVSNN